jgi:hypothetical protein
MEFNVTMLRCFAAVLALTLVACGGGGAVSPDAIPPVTPLPTVAGVGELPGVVATPDVDAALALSVTVTRPVDDDGVAFDTVSELVNGNRVIAIGDSILASTSTRYGGEMCAALTELGWSVEVDAEPGRFVRFGNQVLRQRLTESTPEDEDFDAAIVHLGSNYGSDRDEYYDELNEILFRLAPRPTLLLTVTEYRPAWAEVNSVIDELSALYDNVIVIDWGKIARTPGVLSRDGLHPGNEGEAVLVEQLAVALGRAGTTPGDCLRSSFTDDSAVRGGSSGGSSSGSSSGGSSAGGSSSGGSSSGGSGSGGSSSGGGSTTIGTTTVTTTDESSTDGSTTDETTTDDTSTDGTSTDETTTDDTSTDGTSTDETTTDGTSTDDTSTDGTSTDGTSTDGTTPTATTTVTVTTTDAPAEPTPVTTPPAVVTTVTTAAAATTAPSG